MCVYVQGSLCKHKTISNCVIKKSLCKTSHMTRLNNGATTQITECHLVDKDKSKKHRLPKLFGIFRWVIYCSPVFFKREALDHTLCAIFSVVTVLVTKVNRSPKLINQCVPVFHTTIVRWISTFLWIEIVISHLDYSPDVFEGDKFRDRKTIV